MAKLHILEGSHAGKVVDIAPREQPLVIGSGEGVEIAIGDPWISRHHAAIGFDGRSFWVEDRGSSNGTWLRKERVSRTELADGDVIWFGRTKCRFHVDDAKASAAPAAPSPSPEVLAQAVAAATRPLVAKLDRIEARLAELEAERTAVTKLVKKGRASPSRRGPPKTGPRPRPT